MIRQFLYRALKSWVGIFFNILNFVLVGNLPPFGCVNIVVEEQGRYLVIQRPEGHIVFPGGFMRWRENPEETGMRECKEETGLQVKIVHLIGCSSTPSENITKMSTLTAIYRAEVVGGALLSSIEGKPMWMDEAELHVKLFKQQAGVLEHYLARRDQRPAGTAQSIP